MTENEKLTILEELLDVAPNTLTGGIKLEELSQWDSIANIALIAMFDCDFEKTLTPTQVKNFITVKDIMDEMD